MKSMDKLIQEDILSHLQYYFDLVYENGLDLEIDGVKGFNPKSQFVEGKVVNACSYVYEVTGKDKDKLVKIIKLMADGEYKTWGMLNCIVALNRLNKKGLLNDVMDDETLNIFKEKLDWRTFVNEDDLSLINLPTNYYGVAFGVSKYRELLGFEAEGWSDKLLKKLLNHVDMFSGEFSYMDETQGQGRFDRYSILIPAEVCSMLYETGCEIPGQLLDMLRKSCDIFINLANETGSGFSYGRSIGAYGDTAALEILSISAKLGVLTEDEIDIAYGYNSLTMNRFMNFWVDNETKSLNMWDKGRRTDDYRNKNRILGENLSLSMQIINSYSYWKSLGMTDRATVSDYSERLEKLSGLKKFTFAKGDYDRALYIVRDSGHVFTLPLVSGAEKYYCQTPYLPIPNEFGTIHSTANSSHPNLVPKIVLEDGVELMPVVYIKNINDSEDSVITYELDALAQLGGKAPQKYEGVSTHVTYTLKSREIQCSYVINLKDDMKVKAVEMEYASYGEGSEISVQGLDKVSTESVLEDREYHTPVGSLNCVTKWIASNLDSNTLEISWSLKY